MNIWITGYAGFLGSYLSRAFTTDGHMVIGLSRRKCSSAGKSVSIDLASDDTCQRLAEVANEYGRPDVVVHAASRQPGPYELSAYIRSNVMTTAQLLDSLAQFPPAHLIFTSTLSVYGRPESNPVKESHPIKGELPYAATKWWGEQLVSTFATETQVTVLRLPSLYGVGQRDSLIDGLASLAIKNEPIEMFDRGKMARDTLHVDDVTGAIQDCVTHPPQQRFRCLNLGCGKRITTQEYAVALVGALGSSSPIVPVDRPSRQPFDLFADIDEARRQIGFTPTGMLESLERYADELQSQR